MAFTLAGIVPWGRSFEEYAAMLFLEPRDLAVRVRGCEDGPASFQAEARARGVRIVPPAPGRNGDPTQVSS